MASSELNIRPLVLVPALITLGVTVLRLVGELNNWAPALFSREAGGGGSNRGDLLAPHHFRRLFRFEACQNGTRATERMEGGGVLSTRDSRYGGGFCWSRRD